MIKLGRRLRQNIPSIGYLGIVGIIFSAAVILILFSVIVEEHKSSTFLSIFGTTLLAISVLTLVYEYFMTERVLRNMREAFPYISNPDLLPHELKIRNLYDTLLSISPNLSEREKLEKDFVDPIVRSLKTTIRRDMRLDIAIQKNSEHDCVFTQIDGSYCLENISDREIYWPVPFRWTTVKIPTLDRNDHIRINAMVLRVEDRGEPYLLTEKVAAIQVDESRDPQEMEPMSLRIPENGEFTIKINQGKRIYVTFNFQVACLIEDKFLWRMIDFTDKLTVRLKCDPDIFGIHVGEFCLGERLTTPISQGLVQYEWDSYFLPHHGVFFYWRLKEKSVSQ